MFDRQKMRLKIVGVITGGILLASIGYGFLPATTQEVPIWRKIGQTISVFPSTLTISHSGTMTLTGTTTINGLVFDGVDISLAQGSRIASYQNPSRTATGTVFVTSMGWESGTASSSILLSAFATTSVASVFAAYDYATLNETINGANSFLLRPTVFATSTTATTTDSVVSEVLDRGAFKVDVPPNGYVHLFKQQGDLLATCQAGQNCEKATSTNDGIANGFHLKGIYTQ